MLLIIDLGFFSLLFLQSRIQTVNTLSSILDSDVITSDDDFIPGSSDEESNDGSPSSTKCGLKKVKGPKKMSRVQKKRPATGNYTP